MARCSEFLSQPQSRSSLARPVLVARLQHPFRAPIHGMCEHPQPQPTHTAHIHTHLMCTGALERAGVRPEDVDEVLLGNVISANLGQVGGRAGGCLGGQVSAAAAARHGGSHSDGLTGKLQRTHGA